MIAQSSDKLPNWLQVLSLVLVCLGIRWTQATLSMVAPSSGKLLSWLQVRILVWIGLGT